MYPLKEGDWGLALINYPTRLSDGLVELSKDDPIYMETVKKLEVYYAQTYPESPVTLEVDSEVLFSWAESLVETAFISLARDLLAKLELYSDEEVFVAKSQIIKRILSVLHEDVLYLNDGQGVSLVELFNGSEFDCIYLLFIGFESKIAEAFARKSVELGHQLDFSQQRKSLDAAAVDLGIVVNDYSEARTQFNQAMGWANNCPWLFMWLYQSQKNVPTDLIHMIENYIFDRDVAREHEVFTAHAANVLSEPGNYQKLVDGHLSLPGELTIKEAVPWTVDEDFEYIQSVLAKDPVLTIYFFLSILSYPDREKLKGYFNGRFIKNILSADSRFWSWVVQRKGN